MKLKHIKLNTTLTIGIICFILLGCKNNTPETEATTAVENNQVDTPTKSWHQWTPPSQILDLELTNAFYDTYAKANLKSVNAIYKNNKKVFRLNIIDGTTDKGKSETSKHRKAVSKNVNFESDFGHEKSVDYKGTKALQEYLANVNQYLITLFYKDKYGISIKTEGIDEEDLWKQINELNLNQLD